MMPPLPKDDIDLILRQTASLWEEMRGSRLFLTGGTGFFGCWLVESFVAANRQFNLQAEITVLTRSPEAFQEKCPHLSGDPALTLLRGDIANFDFPSDEYPYVIHAATEASARMIAEQPQLMLATILDGTRRSLDFATTHGTRKYLLTSSGAVYGEQPPEVSHISEDFPGAPNPLRASSVYAEGKRAAELMCAVYQAAFAIECKIARCFAFVGPHLPLDTHFAVGNFLRNAMREESILVEGDGTPRRSYMYAADLAIWLWTMLFRAPSLDPINVGSDQSISIRELANAVPRAIGSPSHVQIAKSPQPGTPLRQYVPSITKAEEMLGLTCSIPLDQALRRTAAWYGYPPATTI
jgi:nucleoside-diphosphate-sugar epimerase